MRKRLKTTTGAVAALVALALGGSAIASATGTQGASHKHAVKQTVAKSTEAVGGPDADNIQSGDQTSPDAAGAKASSAPTPEAPGTESATETSSESTSESSSASDGPGGHEDPPGEVDNQSEAQD
jgi:hypothetical protein